MDDYVTIVAAAAETEVWVPADEGNVTSTTNEGTEVTFWVTGKPEGGNG